MIFSSRIMQIGFDEIKPNKIEDMIDFTITLSRCHCFCLHRFIVWWKAISTYDCDSEHNVIPSWYDNYLEQKKKKNPIELWIRGRHQECTNTLLHTTLEKCKSANPMKLTSKNSIFFFGLMEGTHFWYVIKIFAVPLYDVFRWVFSPNRWRL